MLEDKSIATKPLPGWQTLTTASLLTLVELGWVVPWYLLLINRTLEITRLKAILVLGFVMILAYAITYLLEVFSIISRLRIFLQIIVLISGLALSGSILLQLTVRGYLSALFALSAASIFTFIVVVWMWFRGIRLVQESTHPQTAWHRFRLGLVMYLGYIFLTNWTGIDVPDLGWFVTFLFVGFISLVFARIDYIVERTGGKNPFDRRWLLTMILLIAGLLFGIAILGSLLTGQLSLLVDFTAAAIAWLLKAFLFLLALPGMLIAGLLGTFMAWLRRQLPEAEIEMIENPEPLMPDLFQEPPPEIQPLPQNIQALLFWGIVLLVLILIIWRMSRRARRTRLAVIYQPESLLEPGEARQLLRQALQNTLDDLRARLRPKVKILPPDRIRRIYIELLAMVARMGLARPVNQTPLEFLPAMQSRLSGVAEQLDQITSAYMVVRYGEFPENELPIERLESAWQDIIQANADINKTGSQSYQD